MAKNIKKKEKENAQRFKKLVQEFENSKKVSKKKNKDEAEAHCQYEHKSIWKIITHWENSD